MQQISDRLHEVTTRAGLIEHQNYTWSILERPPGKCITHWWHSWAGELWPSREFLPSLLKANTSGPLCSSQCEPKKQQDKRAAKTVARFSN